MVRIAARKLSVHDDVPAYHSRADHVIGRCRSHCRVGAGPLGSPLSRGIVMGMEVVGAPSAPLRPRGAALASRRLHCTPGAVSDGRIGASVASLAGSDGIQPAHACRDEAIEFKDRIFHVQACGRFVRKTRFFRLIISAIRRVHEDEY